MPSNTPETQALEPVEVTQADRDEAANYLRDNGYWHVDPNEFRSGEKDETPLVQAFARHRQSSNAGGVEIERLAKNFITAHDLSAADPASAELESRELDAISDLRYALASPSTPKADPAGIERSKVVMLERYLRRARRILGSTPSKIADDIDAYFSGNALTPPTPDRIGKDAVREALDELPDLKPAQLCGLSWKQALKALGAVDCALRRPHWCSPVVILKDGMPVIDDDGDIKPFDFMPGDKTAKDWAMVPRVDDDGKDVPLAYRTSLPTPAQPVDETERLREAVMDQSFANIAPIEWGDCEWQSLAAALLSHQGAGE